MVKLERTIPRCRIFWMDGRKFRSNLLILFFNLPLRRETATKTALLAEVLKQGCVPYPTPQALAQQAEEFYGAIWDISVVKKGERQLLLFSMEALKTVEPERMLEFLRTLLLQPLTKDGAFLPKIVERQKRILRERLESLADDKKAYARRRILEETAAGTAYAISGDGYAEDLAGIDGRTLYAFYREMVAEAEVRVLFMGDRQDKAKHLPLRQDFAGRLVQAAQEMPFLAHTEPQIVRERMETAQARLMLGFSGDIASPTRQAALLILVQILGGDADSLLFRQLREEEGLCYDVKAYLMPLSPYLLIQAGIVERDAAKAGRLALDCVQQLRREPISPKRLRQAKEALLQEWEGLGDRPWAMADFFTDRILQGRPLSLEKFLRQIRRVDAEAIRRAAAHLECRAIYLLGAQEREDEHGKKA